MHHTTRLIFKLFAHYDMGTLRRTLAKYGFDPKKGIRLIKRMQPYKKDLKLLKAQIPSNPDFPLGAPYPCLDDRYQNNGLPEGHYFHQDLLVARRIFENNPQRHIDVGSSIEGFVAHVASYRSIEVFDIRPQPNTVRNISFLQADLMSPLPEEYLACTDSLSCLHTIEHFGLGRYGDPVNYDGYKIGLENLSSIVKPGGKFYLSTVIGPQRINFNAHRVFRVKFLLDLLEPGFVLDQFSYVDDAGKLHEDVTLSDEAAENSFGTQYGCGIFELTKR